MNDQTMAADAKALILSFASHIGRAREIGAELVAQRRNWLSETGEVTADGEALLRALDDQWQTRTVFRGNF